MLLLPIQAIFTRQAMRDRLIGSLAGDAVVPERPRRPRRRLVARAMRRG